MTKRRIPLLQRLEQDEASVEPSTAPQNKAVILRLQDEIAAAIGKGYTLLKIWRILKKDGEVKMSYSQFRRLLTGCKIWTPKKGTNKPVEETPATAPADEPEPEIKLIRSHFLSNTNFGVADPYGEQDKDK